MASSNASTSTQDASSSAKVVVAAGQANQTSKTARVLACVQCQNRKIKCERVFPCANCLKTGVICVQSVPAPARKRRRPHQEIQERLAKCEALLKEYQSSAEKQSATPNALSPASSFLIGTTTPSSVDHGYLPWNEASQHRGKLVKEDGGIRFMDSPILSTIYDELKAMRDIVSADRDEDVTSDTMSPDENSDFILGGDTPSSTNPEDLWPEPGLVFRLWQIYLERVNPLTKIIHVPSLQPFVAEATSGCSTLPKNIEALLFSIWLMAVVAMTPEECQSLLGYTREHALQRFSNGVRTALMRMNFLKRHDMTALQALVIYLVSLQGRYNRHAAWILNGVVIRIAQKMGLHRDGELLGLGPFEAEMRRRLWWQIIMLDAKYAMMTGLSHSILPRSWDTKEPKNLNDADLFQNATEPYQDREGPTEMIFCLMTNKIAKFLVETPGLEFMSMVAELESPQRGVETAQTAEFRQVIQKLGKVLLEVLDRYCDPSAGPVHQFAIEVKKQIIEKLSLISQSAKEQQQQQQPGGRGGAEMQGSKDNAFKLAVCALEHEEQNCAASRDKGFLWHALLHFQLDVFIYVAGQLCHRLEGPLVERAWNQVGVVYAFHPELLDLNNKTHVMLARFILKAWGRREAVVFDRTGQMPPTPGYVQSLRSDLPNEGEDLRSDLPTPPAKQEPKYMMNEMFEPDGPAVRQVITGLFDVEMAEWDMFGSGLPMGPLNGETVHGQSGQGDLDLGSWY